MSNARNGAKLLRTVAAIIERDNADEIQYALNLIGKIGKNNGSSAGRTLKKNAIHADFKALLQEISDAKTREEGWDILLSFDFTKNELIGFGRENNIHILKSDTVHDVQEKIVEYFVGSKLSSKAIRGN